MSMKFIDIYLFGFDIRDNIKDSDFYGYVFMFAIYALSNIILIVLGVTPRFEWQTQLYTALGFESTLLVLFGVLLYL